MRRLKQAIRERIHAINARIQRRIEELAFHASIRAIKETRWMMHESVLSATNQVITAEEFRSSARESSLSAMNEALAAYKPPTPWADEVTQVLDSVIAEQFRLQGQVEELERLLREALADRVAMTDD